MLIFTNYLVELFFPKTCVVCRSFGSWWCKRCRQEVGHGPYRAEELTIKNKIIPSAWVAVPYGGVEKALHSFKYQGVLEIGEELGDLMVAYVQKCPGWQHKKFDVVIPVPLHSRRLRERGFNQSAILASCVAKGLQIPSQSLLKRIFYTQHQVGLSADQRRKNITKDLFKASREDIFGKRILLVDDVVTTGATLLSCAHALYNEGASHVEALVLTKN